MLSNVEASADNDVEVGSETGGEEGVAFNGIGERCVLGRGCDEGILSRVFCEIEGRGVLLSETSSSPSVVPDSVDARDPISSLFSSTADMYGSSVWGLLTITIETSFLGAIWGVMGVFDTSSRASTNTSSAL